MTREERTIEAQNMIAAAESDGLWIRWAGVEPDTLWRARTIAIKRCLDIGCRRLFLIVSDSEDATGYCSAACKIRSFRRRRRLRDLDQAGILLDPADPAPVVTTDERARSVRCPRPDKIAWNTREAAELIVTMMRRAKRPRASNMHAYVCDEGGPTGHGCGAYHVGDRTRHRGDPVVARWGSATEREG